MRKRQTAIMGLNSADIVVAIILNLLYTTNHILSCDVNVYHPCPDEHQVCNATSLECDCEPGFTRVGAGCEPAGTEPASHHATAAVVAVFTLALLICGLVLVARKYNLIEYIQQKINFRRNNDVMYEDVMIGQDDPPLSP